MTDHGQCPVNHSAGSVCPNLKAVSEEYSQVKFTQDIQRRD